jgi:hypothetical protein
MTTHEAELCLIFDKGIRHGDTTAVWVVKGVDNAPQTFFHHYELRTGSECTAKYTNLTKLLADVQKIAPIEQWTKEQ